MIVSLFSEARVSSPSIIYIEGIEVITSKGASQILDQMESCENDEAAIVVIGTADNVKTLVTFKDVTKTLKDTMYGISMLDEKDATGEVDGTIVGLLQKSCKVEEFKHNNIVLVYYKKLQS
ncbi:ATPase, AAA-type, core, P-loop containing nucleoside triphosphate hydrolase [Tanacetum coccineum]